MRLTPHPGFFLVLDGPDGGGKTTQAGRLAEWLRGRGPRRRHLPRSGWDRAGRPAPRASCSTGRRCPSLCAPRCCSIMASRAQLVEEVIAPALAAGRVVVSDRYLLAEHRLSGDAPGGLLEEEIALVGMVATSGLLPDLTIVLDIAPDAADGPRRGRARSDRRPPAFHRERVRAGLSGRGCEAGAQARRSDGRCPYLSRADRRDRCVERSRHRVRADSKRG